MASWFTGTVTMGCEGREALEIKLERHGYETAVLDVSEVAASAAAIPGRTGPGAAGGPHPCNTSAGMVLP
jgi:hypothetical protein